MKKLILAPLIFILIFLISLEVGAYFLTKYQLLPYNEKPISEFYAGASRGLSWRNEKSEWGAWHKINYEDTHISSCINAKYKSNNYGARDEDFNVNAEIDYILIGDSFAEGYGINKKDTFEAKLEKKLKKEIYNFGSAGHFGPLQYYLIYNKLAKKFKHKGVLITLLPANDFTDNDRQFWMGRDAMDVTGAKRYRPYWRAQGDGHFDWFYPEGSIKTDCFGCPPPTLRTFLIRYTYFGSVIRSLELVYPNIFKYGKDKEILPDPADYSGYFDSTKTQQVAATYFLEKIINESQLVPVTIVVIPTRNDILRIKVGENYRNQYWYNWLSNMRKDYKKFDYIDLADFTSEKYESLFLSCDGHWSEDGHSWVADVITNELR